MGMGIGISMGMSMGMGMVRYGCEYGILNNSAKIKELFFDA